MDVAKSFCRVNGLARCEEEGETPTSTARLVGAGDRLSLVAALLAIGIVVSLVAGLLVHEASGLAAPHRLLHDRARQAGLLLLSLGVVALLRLGRLSARQVEGLGAAYQLAGAVVLSVSSFGADPLLQATPSLVTWLGVWIVLFPLVAPASPRRTIALALLSAATAPVVFGLGLATRGEPWPATNVVVGTFLPYAICALLAAVPALVLGRLSHAVAEAKSAARHLGAYRLVAKLGEGGMGEVWRAEHRLLARPAAIKLVRPSVDPGELTEALGRFEREARATSRLRSPNTVSLYDYGVAGDGTAYYAMELLEGIDLEQLVRRHGPVSPGRAIHLASQAADALAEAHGFGLVHRDVKPANLFAARLGLSVDVLKVMDFGLVTLAAHARGAVVDARATSPRHLVGTPAYIAPEQVMRPETVDARSDLYALGCVLYWLATGHAPFEHPSPVRLLIDHAQTPPTPPSQWNPAVPADLERVILDLLAKDPAARPQTAQALKARLAACEDAGTWSDVDAQAWWAEQLPAAPSTSTPLPGALVPLPKHPQSPLPAPRRVLAA